MSFDGSNILVRLLVACLAWYLFSVVIDTFVKDTRMNEVFKIILIFVCIAIVFVSGFFIRF